MYIRKRNIEAGIREQKEGYVFDYTYNYPSDIVNLVSPQLYRSTHGNRVYWFGYEFNPGVSSYQRKRFIDYVKGVGDRSMPDEQLEKFIQLPLKELNSIVNTYHIDCFVYPKSGRSPLVSKMISAIARITSRDMDKCSIELVKSAPTDIQFDWDSFDADYSGNANRYNQARNYVEEVILPGIAEKDYFSLAACVKPKYRKYITNLFQLSYDDINRLSGLQGSNILIVDDINTSGSTIDEVLRIIQKLNTDCNVFIYTLIGHPEI